MLSLHYIIINFSSDHCVGVLKLTIRYRVSLDNCLDRLCILLERNIEVDKLYDTKKDIKRKTISHFVYYRGK